MGLTHADWTMPSVRRFHELPGADGRIARGERARLQVAEAMLALIYEGDLRPTAPRIAERAGVSLRSVFHHFDDLETLFEAAARLQTERVLALVRPIDVAQPLADRRSAFIAQRARVYEAVTPVRRAAMLSEHTSRVIAERLGMVRARKRAEAERIFAAELAAFAPEERPRRARALAAAASWMTWETLRAHQGLSVEEAEEVLGTMITAILHR